MDIPVPAPIPVEPVLPKRRRNRTIQSCFYCRTRKLKCDREKPSCSTCTKLETPCEYISSGTATEIQSVHAITEKIDRLEKEVSLLKTKRNSLMRATKKDKASKAEEPIILGHALSLFSPIRRDPFLNKLLELYKANIMSAPPKEIKEEFEAMRNPISKVELIKIGLRNDNKQLSDLIRPHLADLSNVWYLTTKFFDSELYASLYFIDKDSFLAQLHTISSSRMIFEEGDYLFFGQLLIIMRITYLSFYNCGYNQEEVNALKSVDSDVFYLARLCLEHAAPLMMDMSTPYIQLLSLTIFYQTFTPDQVGAVHDWAMSDLNKLMRSCFMMEFNLDQEDDIPRRVWFSVLELDVMRFLYDGTPLSIGSESYSTELPSECKNSYQQTVNAMLKERTSVHQLIQPISDQLNNAREPPTIRKYERQIDILMEFLEACNLRVIMDMPSHSVEQKIIKMHKFNNFMDLASLCFMLCTHVLLYFFETDDVDNSARFSLKVIKCLNSLNPIAYFLDNQTHHEFNLNAQFGLNFHIIPKINQILHRCFQVHFTLLIRLLFLQSRGARANLQDSMNLLISNTEIILTNFGKIADKFSFARCLYKFGSDSILTTIGSNADCNVRQKLLQWLNQSNELEFDPDFQYILPKDITDNLVPLRGDINILPTAGVDILDLFLENGLDPFSVQKIESLLFTS